MISCIFYFSLVSFDMASALPFLLLGLAPLDSTVECTAEKPLVAVRNMFGYPSALSFRRSGEGVN